MTAFIISSDGQPSEQLLQQLGEMLGGMFAEMHREQQEQEAAQEAFKAEFKPYIDAIMEGLDAISDRVQLIYHVSPSLNASRRPWIDNAVSAVRTMFGKAAQHEARPEIGASLVLGSRSHDPDKAMIQVAFIPDDEGLNETGSRTAIQHRISFKFTHDMSTVIAEEVSMPVNLPEFIEPLSVKILRSPDEITAYLKDWFERVGGIYAPIKIENALSRGEWLDRMAAGQVPEAKPAFGLK